MGISVDAVDWYFVVEDHVKVKVVLLNEYMDAFHAGGCTSIPSFRLRLHAKIMEIMTERGLPV